jgi:hypothetical protein
VFYDGKSGDAAVTCVEDALSAMDAALDFLLDTDSAAFTGRHRELLAQLSTRRNRFDAVTLRVTSAFDASEEWQLDGAANAKAWLRAHLRMTPPVADALVRTAHRSADVPEMTEALRAGDVSLRHVQVVTDAMGRTAERRDTIAAADPTFAAAARELDPQQLSRVVARWKHAVDPQAVVEGECTLRAQRFLAVDTTFDGAVVLRGLYDGESGAIIKTALDAISTAGFRTDRAERLANAGALGDSDTPTPAQRRADALTELCRRYLNSGEAPEIAGARPHVAITVTHEALAAAPGEFGHPPAELEGVGPISAEAARRLTCDATVTGFTLDTGGRPVAYGRTRRTVPPSLRGLIVLRDQHCVFPGCDRPAAWCEAHHLVHWEHGGPTDADNLALVCVHHHHTLHEHGFTTHGSPQDGTLTFHRPDGSELHVSGLRSGP